MIKKNTTLSVNKSNKHPSIINGIVENDPDVDALFRLTCNHSVSWEPNKKIIISNKNICVFNTQNTFWIDPEIFISLLLPCSVSDRYCDILRSIITNIILRKKDKNMAYTSPNVKQIRNKHDLINDFKLEYPMYIANENILDHISDNIDEISNDKDLIKLIYDNLLKHNVITDIDIEICNEWLSYF